MPRTLGSPRHRALVDFIIKKREKSGMKQWQVADLLRVPQSYIAKIEAGQRRVDVVELMELGEVLGFGLRDVSRVLAKVKR